MKDKESEKPAEIVISDTSDKNKSSPIINATLIGFLIGIIIWSVAKNNVGLFTLIPLFFLYKLLNRPKASSGSKTSSKK